MLSAPPASFVARILLVLGHAWVALALALALALGWGAASAVRAESAAPAPPREERGGPREAEREDGRGEAREGAQQEGRAGTQQAEPGKAREAEPATSLPRLVTLNPSLTAIVLALDAREALVGVDDWSARAEPAVAELPRVGGLFNPSVESILALRPDVVAVVPAAQQRGLHDRLEALGIEVLVLENITLPEVLGSIEELGERLQRAEQARSRVNAIRAAWTRAERHARRHRPLRTVWVLQRDPLYVVGRGSFLDAMLRAAGAQNAAAVFDEPYPRVGVEWLIAARPDLIIDAAAEPENAAAHWSRWPSLPAVAEGRVVSVPRDEMTMPGPDLDVAVKRLEEIVSANARRPREPSP